MLCNKGKTKKLKIFIVVAVMILAVIIAGLAIYSQKSNIGLLQGKVGKEKDEILAATERTGICGGCSWKIDTNGVLTISKTSGGTGVLSNMTSAGTVPWDEYRDEIKEVNFGQGVSSNALLIGMFQDCKNLKKVDLTNFNTSSATDMAIMFYRCSSLETIIFGSEFKTDSVTRMRSMFNSCSSLRELDVSCFNTENVTDMFGMFGGCLSLRNLNISSFDTHVTQNMNSMLPEFLTNIAIGEKTSFKTDTDGGYPFGRGTWKRLEDGKLYSVVEICNKSLNKQAAGTYVKISDMSNEVKVDYPVKFKINKINKIDNLIVHGNTQFVIQEDGKILSLKDLNWQSDNGQIVITDSVELVFNNVVTDSNENEYDLKMIISNIHFNNISSVSDNILTRKILQVDNNGVIQLLQESVGSTGLNFDIKMQVTKDNIVQEGSFIFSANDIDIESPSGYNEYSEGVNFIERI